MGAKLHVVTDSTVGYWDDGVSWASARLERTLRAHNVRATVDAVNGSGFVARADEQLHFQARTGKIHPSTTHVLVVGGWNDASARAREVKRAVEAYAAWCRRPTTRSRAGHNEQRA